MAFWPTSVATDANLYVAVNSLQTTLAGAINSAVTTITLTSSSNFPTAGAVTIDSEVIFYTGISGADLTGCVRGSDGTTAASHGAGVPVGATIVAFHHNGLKNEIIAIETSLNFANSFAIVSNGSGRLVVSAVTATEIGYLSGVTSAIQTQLNAKATDSLVVHLAGIETITGAKTFSANPTISINGTANWIVTSTANAGNAGLDINGKTTGGSAQEWKFGVGINQTDASLEIRDITGGSDKFRIVPGSTTGVQIKGTGTNDDAAAGFMGEYVESIVASVSGAANNTWGDLTSISLTKGDWDISVMDVMLANGAVFTSLDVEAGIGTASGTSTTGLAAGDTQSVIIAATFGTTAYFTNVVVPRRVSINVTTTYYLKTYTGSYTSGTPKHYARISARRVR